MPDFTPRATVYKQYKMRSRLEAAFAGWLDQNGAKWEYEPCAFGSSHGQYLPDFRLLEVQCSWRETPQTVYVETKPKDWPFAADGYDIGGPFEMLMRSMAIIWESEPDAVLVLAQPPDNDEHDYARAGILDPMVGLDPPMEHPWPLVGLWVVTQHGGIGLATPYGPMSGPWPDGYWKPRPA